jgi:hypothetical protein
MSRGMSGQLTTAASSAEDSLFSPRILLTFGTKLYLRTRIFLPQPYVERDQQGLPIAFGNRVVVADMVGQPY